MEIKFNVSGMSTYISKLLLCNIGRKLINVGSIVYNNYSKISILQLNKKYLEVQ